jgi:hypothetical protein
VLGEGNGLEDIEPDGPGEDDGLWDLKLDGPQENEGLVDQDLDVHGEHEGLRIRNVMDRVRRLRYCNGTLGASATTTSALGGGHPAPLTASQSTTPLGLLCGRAAKVVSAVLVPVPLLVFAHLHGLSSSGL